LLKIRYFSYPIMHPWFARCL